MKKIIMTYNPYLKEAELQDGTGNNDEWLDAKKKNGEEFGKWCSEFLKHLIDKYNDKVEIDFSGIERDCDSLEDAVLDFNKNNPGFEIKFTRRLKFQNSDVENGVSKIEKLKMLYDDIRSKDCPFSDLRDNVKIEESFCKALDNDFEIAVVATMSSGKSTLINAMLGTELLPARNEATTATLSYIHDEDDTKEFRCEYFDSDGIKKEVNPVTLEIMNELNNNCIPEIQLYGDIIGISSQKLKLVLTDTHGPNNSSNEDHKTHTFKVIKDSKYKPMILYVLNGTQLETNDDNTLLNIIADAMSEGGRQASDRFIFVLNKADEFDPEKGESVTRMIEKTVKYLEGHGIKNPKIFPCSAYFAKIIRQDLAGKQFTRKEKIDLQGNIALFIDEKDMHFSDMAPLSSSVREKINKQLFAAKNTNDDRSEALIHTGIPAVEGAISEYLEKYALPAKITEALHSFKQIIDDIDDETKERDALKENEEKKAEVEAAIEIMQQMIDKGNRGQTLKAKIDALSVDDKIKEAYEDLSGKKISDFVNSKKNQYNKTQVTHQIAEKYISELKASLEEFSAVFELDIQNLINKNIGEEARRYVEEYNKYVSELLGCAFKHTVEASAVLGCLAHMQFSSDDINNYEFEKREKVGSHTETKIETRTEYQKQTKTKKVKQSGVGGGVKRFFGGLFGKDWGYEYKNYTEEIPVERQYEVDYEVDDYAMRSYVNFAEFFKVEVIPEFDKFASVARDIAFENAKVEEKKLKNSFKVSFDELNKKIADKLEEQKKALSSKEDFEKMIKQNEKNIEWITDFKNRLNEALSN